MQVNNFLSVSGHQHKTRQLSIFNFFFNIDTYDKTIQLIKLTLANNLNIMINKEEIKQIYIMQQKVVKKYIISHSEDTEMK